MKMNNEYTTKSVYVITAFLCFFALMSSLLFDHCEASRQTALTCIEKGMEWVNWDCYDGYSEIRRQASLACIEKGMEWVGGSCYN